MSIASNLEKLIPLKEKGDLSSVEFAKAKESLLTGDSPDDAAGQTPVRKAVGGENPKNTFLIAILSTISAALAIGSATIDPSPVSWMAFSGFAVASMLNWILYFKQKIKSNDWRTCRIYLKDDRMRVIKSLENLVLSSLLLSMLLTMAGCDGEGESEILGHGYKRKGGFIFHKGKRIDKEAAHDLDKFALIARQKLILAKNVDAASFKPLSPDYCIDKNKVYYKWISGHRFWMVEIQKADPESFEVLGLALAKDKNHVWKEDRMVEGADPQTTQILTDRVWKDAQYVWFYGNVVKDADAATFESLGDDYHYRDASCVYWIFNVAKVVEGADPNTFKIKRK